ncbi:hypothetical protein Syun_021035 [Stephania yunnanensis]|uniref:Uncharacterized protein n=1 Tax=Stephania yunnanensis TaxID=152371 RepID=A0AAP0IF26_9MAGN
MEGNEQNGEEMEQKPTKAWLAPLLNMVVLWTSKASRGKERYDVGEENKWRK